MMLLSTTLFTNLSGFDLAVRGAVHSLASPPLTTAMRIFTFIGSMLMSWSFTILLAAWLWSKRLHRDTMLLLATMLGAEVWNDVLKIVIRRPRPEAFFGTALPESYSFPSGHALFAMCLYLTLAAIFSRIYPHAHRVLWAGAVLMILAIGLSRIYLGVHYPSDVAGGYVIGLLWVSAVRACVSRLRSRGPSVGERLGD